MKIRKGLVICGLIGSVVGAFLMTSKGFALTSGMDRVTFTIPTTCTLNSTSNVHTDTVVNNTYRQVIGGTPNTITTFCNDSGGYVIYADGYSNNEEGNNNLIGDNGGTIPSGTATSGSNSAWSFELAALDNTLIMNPLFTGNPAIIPSSWTWVAKKTSGITATTGSSITASYGAFVSSSQSAGTYKGQVKYILLHPSTAPTPITFSSAFANNSKTKYKGYYKMQDMTTEICSSVNVFNENSEIELIDVRDDKIYWVTKLEDGHCWMTENLDLDLSDEVALNSNDTNLEEYGSNNYDSNHGYSRDSDMVIYWLPERGTIAPDDLDSNTWQDNSYYPYSYDSGIVAPNGEKDGHGFTGNYYNWSAVIASNDSSLFSSLSPDAASNSICPKGWRLPNPDSEFLVLLKDYSVLKSTLVYDTDGYNKLISSPLYFVDSGSISNGAVVSTATNYLTGVRARGIYFNSSTFGNYLLLTAQWGSSVRCIAK